MPKIPSSVEPRPLVGLSPDLGEWQSKYTLLSSTLSIAVPLWIEQLRHAGWEHVEARAKACSQVVAEKGDVILFRVPDGIKIGMVKGGPLESSGGFGFPDGSGLAAFKANPPDKEVKTRKTRASKTEDDTVDA